LPEGMEGSIQTKAENSFAGSTLGINNGYIKSLSSSDVGFTGGNASLRLTPNGLLEHRQENNLWSFRSSFSDNTFQVKNSIVFDPENSQSQRSISVRNPDLISLKSQNNNSESEMLHGSFGTQFTYTSGSIYRIFSTTASAISFTQKENNSTTVNFIVNKNGLNLEMPRTLFTVDDVGIKYKLRMYTLRDYFSYMINEQVLKINNSIQLTPDDNINAPDITLTPDKDLKFSRKASPANSITLTEIIQKGQIFKQEAEPTIPDDSFAFWINEDTFYLILNSSGVQKKVQLQ